ncbi:MAG: C45 family peptidase [Pirellulales bacterium]
MNDTSEQNMNQVETPAPATSRRRWKRGLRLLAIAILIAVVCAAYLLKDHIRTLQSLRRIPGTNAYVLDYYVDYNIDAIRSQGMDVKNIEDGLIRVFFPKVLVPIATSQKGMFIQEEIETLPAGSHRCSTVMLHSPGGNVFFGRNFDWKHDACLVVKNHDGQSLSSIAVIDLHYLNLDRDDLETISLIERIPLLFAPYYLQDGMNRHGVAVADMSVENVDAPYDAAKPNLMHSTAMRLILDYAKSTDDAIALLRKYNIHFAETTCHLMIADSTGKSAVVEFIDGNLIATPTDESWQVCTNHQVAGKAEAENDQSCERYRLASDQLATLPSAAGAADVMKIMESVAQANSTMWTSVYDLATREFHLAYRREFGRQYRDGLTVSN